MSYVCVPQDPLYPDTLVVSLEYAWSGLGMSSADSLYKALALQGYTPEMYDIVGGRSDAYTTTFGSANYFVNLGQMYLPGYRRVIIMHNGWREDYLGALLDAVIPLHVNILMYGCVGNGTAMPVMNRFYRSINYGFFGANATMRVPVTGGDPNVGASFNNVQFYEPYCWDMDLGNLNREPSQLTFLDL